MTEHSLKMYLYLSSVRYSNFVSSVLLFVSHSFLPRSNMQIHRSMPFDLLKPNSRSNSDKNIYRTAWWKLYKKPVRNNLKHTFLAMPISLSLSSHHSCPP